jgi:dTDP-4-dehydrorhamnose 3,5-epimerase
MVGSVVDFTVAPTEIGGLHVLTMKQVSDERGTIRELYRESAFTAAGLSSLGPWVQVNATETRRGGVRGLHAEDMDKLVAVAAGEAFGAYVDARPGSASYGRVVTLTLVPGLQVLVPRGVANGFQAIAEPTQYVYCFDREWQPGMAGVACSPIDPALGIDWPIQIDPADRAQISEKDASAPLFAELASAPR